MDHSEHQSRTGEHQELAWLLKLDLTPGLTSKQRNILLTDFMDFAEQNRFGLARYRGSFLVVSLVNRKCVTVQEQHLLTNWLMARLEVTRIYKPSVAPEFLDAWSAMLLADADSETKTFEEFFS